MEAQNVAQTAKMKFGAHMRPENVAQTPEPKFGAHLKPQNVPGGVKIDTT